MSPPILRLAQTELRLVAHRLVAHVIMRLARCCKAFMAAVDSPFTFKYSSLAVTCCRTLLHLSPAFRPCPLGVRWMLPEGALAATEQDVTPLLGSNLSIRSFDASGCFHVPVRLWYSLLGDPAISRVHDLIVLRSDRQMSMDFTFLDRLMKLPFLCSLSLGRTSGKARWIWDRITPPTSLTRLRITDASPAAGNSTLAADSCLPWIAQCTELQRLHLSPTAVLFFWSYWLAAEFLSVGDHARTVGAQVRIMRPRSSGGEHGPASAACVQAPLVFDLASPSSMHPRRQRSDCCLLASRVAHADHRIRLSAGQPLEARRPRDARDVQFHGRAASVAGHHSNTA